MLAAVTCVAWFLFLVTTKVLHMSWNVVYLLGVCNNCLETIAFSDSRARLVAGSFQGYKGHVDGKPSDARFNQPKGVTMDDKGNVYVADTLNLAIRKIVDAGTYH